MSDSEVQTTADWEIVVMVRATKDEAMAVLDAVADFVYGKNLASTVVLRLEDVA